MNFIKRIVREYKINNGKLPQKVVTLSNGLTFEHFVRFDNGRRVVRIELKG